MRPSPVTVVVSVVRCPGESRSWAAFNRTPMARIIPVPLAGGVGETDGDFTESRLSDAEHDLPGRGGHQIRSRAADLHPCFAASIESSPHDDGPSDLEVARQKDASRGCAGG